MNKKLIVSLSMLAVLVGLYYLNSSFQNSYKSQSKKLMNFEEKNLKKIIIQSGEDAIEIIKRGHR